MTPFVTLFDMMIKLIDRKSSEEWKLQTPEAAEKEYYQFHWTAEGLT